MREQVSHYGTKYDVLNQKDLQFDLVVTGSNNSNRFGEEFAHFYSSNLLELTPDERDYQHLLDNLDSHKLGEVKRILAVGGGSIVDYAKVLAAELALDNPEIFLAVIPTALSNDSYFSKGSSLRRNGQKGSYISKRPDMVFGVREILESEDIQELTLGGWGDHLSKYSSLAEWKFSSGEGFENFNYELYNKELQTLKSLGNTHSDLFSHFKVSGEVYNEFGTSRPLSGGEHTIAHVYSDIVRDKEKSAGAKKFTYDSDHGKRVALFSIFTIGLHEENATGSNIIKLDQYKELLKEKGLPTTLDELGVAYEDFEQAVLDAPSRRERYGIIDAKIKSGELTRDNILDYSRTFGLVQPNYLVEVETELV